MEGPVITIAGKQLMFGVDGNVVDNACGAVLGTWTSAASPGDNKFRYTIDGAGQKPLTAAYSFGCDLDNSNQLQVQLAAADGSATSAPYSYVGGIEIDQQNQVSYFLTDHNGARTNVCLTIYGCVSFSQAENNLVIALVGGGTATVAGLGLDGFLRTGPKDYASFKGEDLLEFIAQTTNTIAGLDDALLVDAVIKYYGNWDIQGGGLVFQSNIQNSAAGAQVKLGFAGQLKGVTAGFAYYSGEGNTNLAFHITGRHTFHSGADASWTSSIGYSNRSFRAAVTATANIPVGNNKLTLSGSLTLKNGDGTNQPSMDFSLHAQYAFDKNGILKFSAAVDQGGPTPSYDLNFSGTFNYSHLDLTFSVDFNDKNGQAIAVAIGIKGDPRSIIQNLQLAFNYTQAQATASLNLSFSARVRFVDGVKVVEPGPALTSAGASQ